MARGKKNCVNCNTELGARTQLCSCGYHFPSGEMKKDLLQKIVITKEQKIYDTEGQGRKKCPECDTIQAAIYKKCVKCNYDFSILSKQKKDEREEKKAEKEKIRAEKQQVKDEVSAEKKAKKEVEKEVLSPLTKRLLLIPLPGESKKLTPKQHAKRILSYGEERSSILLQIARQNSYWKHVDWNIVEEGLKN